MTADLHAALVLHELRRAGRRGVRFVDLRDKLGGESAQPALDVLAERGHIIVRCPDRKGRPLAVLVADELGGPA